MGCTLFVSGALHEQILVTFLLLAMQRPVGGSIPTQLGKHSTQQCGSIISSLHCATFSLTPDIEATCKFGPKKVGPHLNMASAKLGRCKSARGPCCQLAEKKTTSLSKPLLWLPLFIPNKPALRLQPVHVGGATLVGEAFLPAPSRQEELYISFTSTWVRQRFLRTN